MKICYFGIFDPNFSRNRTYIRGLRSIGVEIIECRDNSPFLRKFIRLWQKHKKIKNNYDALIVGYPGHLVVPLAKILSKRIVIADFLGSLYDAEIHSHFANWWQRIKLRTIDYLAVRFADIILLESFAQKKYFESFFGNSEKYKVVYTGVYEDVFFRRENEKYSPFHNDIFNVFFRGKLTPECGIDYILNAAKILKNNEKIKFTIIGRGYLLKHTKDIIAENGLHNVTLISDFVPDEVLREKILQASLYLGQFEDNHRLKRTIPHKTFEALAMGIPFLTEDAPAVRELIVEGHTGFLVPLSSAQAIADKIDNLFQDDSLLREVSNNSRALFKKELSSDKLAEKIESIICSTR